MNEIAETDVKATVPSGWEGILDPGERILWQGRPGQGFHLEPHKLIPAVFGLVFAGFALFWMVMAAQSGGGFWMFGLIHFTVGLWLTAHSLFWGSFVRRRTWYTLSDKRAFFATDLPFKGKQLASYPITRGTPLAFHEGRDTVVFAKEERRGNKGRRFSVDIGFEHIEDAKKVYRLMNDLRHHKESEQ